MKKEALHNTWTKNHSCAGGIRSSEVLFKINYLFILDVFILEILCLIMNINYFWGDLSDISAKKASLIGSGGYSWRTCYPLEVLVLFGFTGIFASRPHFLMQIQLYSCEGLSLEPLFGILRHLHHIRKGCRPSCLGRKRIVQ